MSTKQPTDGRLYAEEGRQPEDRWHLWHENGIAHIARVSSGLEPDASGEANARRLAACWNACRGFSTEDLERGADLAVLVESVRRLLDVIAEPNETVQEHWMDNALQAVADALDPFTEPPGQPVG